MDNLPRGFFDSGVAVPACVVCLGHSTTVTTPFATTPRHCRVKFTSTSLALDCSLGNCVAGGLSGLPAPGHGSL